MIKVAVPGVNGRMGQAVANAVLQNPAMQLVVATVRDSAMVGKKVANSDVVITSGIAETGFDVLIDFTLPEGVMQHLDYCVAHKKAMVIGTTGLSVQQMQRITEASKTIPIVMSANMSVAVNVCFKLLAAAAKMLGPDWQMSITDLHHQHKKDAPSGTAKHMAKILAENSGQDVIDVAIDSQRYGDIVGTHIVSFKSPTDIITIAHEANDRGIFAQGAVAAATWLHGKPIGLYSMLDVIA